MMKPIGPTMYAARLAVLVGRKRMRTLLKGDFYHRVIVSLIGVATKKLLESLHYNLALCDFSLLLRVGIPFSCRNLPAIVQELGKVLFPIDQTFGSQHQQALRSWFEFIVSCEDKRDSLVV